jgi:hypothetical protein
MTPTTQRLLTLDDIADARAYERERDTFRAEVIELKKRRRCHLGPVLTLVFENRTTVRFQIQEMARVERIMTDEGIQHELDTYNVLIPPPGGLAATLFLELTNEAQLREWLPRLVGIERSLLLRLADGTEVRCRPEAQHEAALTREETTAAVHYVHWALSADQIEGLAAGPAVLASDHPEYGHEIPLSAATVEELLEDLRGG